MTAVTSAPASGAFAVLLRTGRETRGWSQAQLANAIGSDHSTLSRLESGQRNPSRAMVLRLADALHATDAERSALLGAAGFASDAPIADPLVAELDAMLRDETVCAECRQDIRDSVTVALMIVQRRLERGEGRVAA